jgi:hypothetical protein
MSHSNIRAIVILDTYYTANRTRSPTIQEMSHSNIRHLSYRYRHRHRTSGALRSKKRALVIDTFHKAQQQQTIGQEFRTGSGALRNKKWALVIVNFHKAQQQQTIGQEFRTGSGALRNKKWALVIGNYHTAKQQHTIGQEFRTGSGALRNKKWALVIGNYHTAKPQQHTIRIGVLWPKKLVLIDTYHTISSSESYWNSEPDQEPYDPRFEPKYCGDNYYYFIINSDPC